MYNTVIHSERDYQVVFYIIDLQTRMEKQILIALGVYLMLQVS